ncbi:MULTISPECIES: alpha/beta fold hydrolase [unclassified Streptomyces]|uniref:thioesterase II family protein n=1 Tax=unclassified Streptomyces TaxID=2593676 RepID=UPI0029B0ABCB|nr:alpha/beta fold hydrolase [Streptomyces sp. DK15]MDX2392818.1 alpha/beta fold hydrolase [Streptomyces sp. DK15]
MIDKQNADGWIRRYHAADESPIRLVCLPHAGGSASFYFPMSQALAPGVDVLSVQYPGRQDRRHEPGITDIGVYADALTRALLPWLDRPVALFGHSMGAILAFEVTRRLERDHGVSPVRIFASGRRSPSSFRHESVHLRDDDGVVAEMRELSGTNSAILGDEEILRMVLPAIRSDYTAIENYRAEPGETVKAPVTVLTGESDPRTSAEEAEAWEGHTGGEFDIHRFPGGHFFLANHQAQVLKIISDDLAAAPIRKG